MRRGYFYLLITFFLYGSLYVANKFVLQSVPPFTLLCVRQLIAALALGAFALKKGLKPVQRGHWRFFITLGLVGYFVSVSLQTLATKLMNASVAALVNSVNPIFISLFAVVLLKEKLTVNKVAGILCSLVGVGIVLGIPGGGGSLLGIGFSLASVVFWSLASVLVRKISAAYPTEQITATGLLISLPFYAASSAVELQVQPAHFTPTVILLVFYLALCCTGCGYYLWNRSLSLLDASVCSLFYPLQTLFASILGIILLHEVLSVNFVVGGLLISAGIVIGLFRRKTAVEA